MQPALNSRHGISLDVYGIIDEVLLDANASDPYDEIYSKLDQS